MTFLNGLLAFGAAAFAVPLLIHLLHRGRSTTVDWGAMHLLLGTKSSDSRRIQWQQLLLLLFRCMIPILLALAMSRPLIPTWQSAGGRSAVSLALILDDSSSMFSQFAQGQGRENTTPFSQACLAASKILRGLPSGSVGSVFLGGATPERLPSQNPDELANQVERLAVRKVPSGELNLPASIQDASQWLADSPHSRRQIIVVSDMQSNEWKKTLRVSGMEIGEWVAQQTVVPELALLHLGADRKSKKADNLFVDSIKVNASLTSIDKETPIASVISNAGDSICDSITVVLLDNDFEIDRQLISVAANSKSTMLSRWIPKKAGDHVLKVQIVRDDDLMADNALSVVSHVFEPIGVVLVDGDRKALAMQSETDFMKLALSPFDVSQWEQRNAFAITVIGPDELNEDFLDGCRVLCLCNVVNLTPSQVSTVHAFVKEGNGLLTFLGDRVETETYQAWPTVDSDGIRLGSIGKRESTVIAEKSESDLKAGITSVHLKVQGNDFQPIRELSKASQGALEKVEFKFRHVLELESKCQEPPFGASVAAEFEDGHPWIVESNLGEGRCLWISTAIDDDDSNLPTKSVFVPLVQRLVAYAAKLQSTKGNIAVGTTWAIHANKNTKLTLAKPDGTFDSIETNDVGRVDLPSMRLLGNFLARPVVASETPHQNGIFTANQELKGASEVLETGIYAACVSQFGLEPSNEPSQESKLEYLEQQEAATLAKSWNASLAATVDQLFAFSQRKWFGREIWFWIWTALLICFLAEIALEQWLSPRLRGRRASGVVADVAVTSKASPVITKSNSTTGGKQAS